MNADNKVIISARDFAIRAHGRQKYGNRPYVYHLDAVYNTLRRWWYPGHPENQDLLDAAYLHDVLEDTGVDGRALSAFFNGKVLDMVEAVTMQKDWDPQAREETLKRYYQYIRASWPEARLLKLADRLANVENCVAEQNTSLLKRYKKEYPLLKKMLYEWHNDDHPIYKTLAEPYWQLLDVFLK